MFAELTVLGFIGLISFVLVKMGVLSEISVAVFRVPGDASEAEIEVTPTFTNTKEMRPS